MTNNVQRISGQGNVSDIFAPRDRDYIKPDPWVRKSDWLPMPDFSVASEFIGLYAVIDGSMNTVCITTTATGGFTVDWGDGTVTNYSSGADAQYTYTYSSIDSGTTTSEGYRQVVIKVYPQTPGNNLTSLNIVKPPTVTGFVNSNTVQNWLDIKHQGTLDGTPHFTVDISNSATYMKNAILERAELGYISGNLNYIFYGCHSLSLVSLTCQTNMSATSAFYGCYNLREVPKGINYNALGSCSTMFAQCYSLVAIPPMRLSNSCNGMFLDCYSLRSVPIFVSTSTTASSIFSGCSSLEDASGISLANWVGAFNLCYSLKYFPNNNKFIGTSFSNTFTGTQIETAHLVLSDTKSLSSTFSGCANLKYAKIEISGNGSYSGASAFQNCYRLKEVEIVSEEGGGNGFSSISNMFYGCTSLQEITGTIYLVGVTSVQNIFSGCSNLIETPTITRVSGTIASWSSAFSTCRRLKRVTNVPSGMSITTFTSTFESADSIEEIPAFDLSGVTTDSASMFNGRSIKRSLVTGLRASHSYANNLLSATALNEIYTNLGSVSGKTITVTGNPGVDSDNPTIATAKGWTVSG